ncbi:hypothetical protein E4U23_005782 [Claviceps purpurea]|nr:hypothetical protein E4U23_005782 [Claviceps purpurea]
MQVCTASKSGKASRQVLKSLRRILILSTITYLADCNSYAGADPDDDACEAVVVLSSANMTPQSAVGATNELLILPFAQQKYL